MVVDETSKAVTPFGGLCSFIVYLQQIGFGVRVAQAMPFPTSPNAIPLAHTFAAFFFAVVTGASRFAHVDCLRGDRALHALFGLWDGCGSLSIHGGTTSVSSGIDPAHT